jgi:hypothetical protein
MSSSSMEFRAALKKGSGRAMILLREAPGDQEYKTALMDACQFNQPKSGSSLLSSLIDTRVIQPMAVAPSA